MTHTLAGGAALCVSPPIQDLSPAFAKAASGP